MAEIDSVKLAANGELKVAQADVYYAYTSENGSSPTQSHPVKDMDMRLKARPPLILLPAGHGCMDDLKRYSQPIPVRETIDNSRDVSQTEQRAHRIVVAFLGIHYGKARIQKLISGDVICVRQRRPCEDEAYSQHTGR